MKNHEKPPIFAVIGMYQIRANSLEEAEFIAEELDLYLEPKHIVK